MSTKVFLNLGAAETPQSSKDFTPAAENIDTRFGKLEYPGGYPTEETVQKVYDELDLQRATRALPGHVPGALHERYADWNSSRLWHKKLF